MPTEIGTRSTLPRIYLRLRLLGQGLGMIAVVAVFYELKLHIGFYIGLVVYCLCFPLAAYWYASRAKKSRAAEFNSFCFNAFAWGIWISIMQFNLLPSATLVAGLHTESAGGWRLYWKGLAMLGCGIVAGIVFFGFNWQPVTSFNIVVACVPGVILFSLLLGITNYNLSRSLARQHRQALEQSRTDGLSGLMNRDYFDIRSELEFHRCQRGAHVSTFIMIDIDHFKQTNDRHGHLVGDKIIQDISALFIEEVREIDFVARYGGEEFCLCLVDTNAAAACGVAERIRAKVEDSISVDGHACTISCGVAEYCNHYRSYQAWLNKADKALYRAKRLGRNRVEVAEQPSILHDTSPAPNA